MTRTENAGLVVTTPSDLEIVTTRTFRAPRQLVFDAYTKCEHLKRWLGPRGWTLPVCEIDLRPGGSWHYVHRGPDGMEMTMSGEFLVVSPPGQLVQTESFGGEEFEQMGGGTINTLVLEEHDGLTTVTTTIAYKSREARDAALQTPMEAGMAESADRLAELLQTLR